ncbi:M14 family metallopeptidase [Bdellovibrio bacteriovorus]|uniref:carboxypeptidase T n=1 Tax=Bdellovibrio bacteriovorus str. Tiberius TaxID=1069642 RepID=K7Z1B9_BDEBC|nr:M14 family metallopeptidase [Bdellovibrio bacteriovorus]AFY02835.1 carboxypeptidase T precursor [Bdellovibrio bacteriovorus str. Tiberius]
MKKTTMWMAAVAISAISFLPLQNAQSVDTTQYWMKVRAEDKFQRSLVANTGASIEATREDYVIAVGSLEEKNAVEKLGLLEVSFPMTDSMDFPAKDAAFHNYAEMTDKLRTLTSQHTDISQMNSIGKSLEGRDIWAIRISGDLANADTFPAAIFMGGHHAREHLSIELPLYYVEYLLTEYSKGNPRIQRLVNARDLHFIPMVNPDGAEFDISTGSYKSWRKNRRQNSNGTYGVDLNRNYGYGWGGGGASTSPSSDTFRGPSAFSEPETQAIKRYVESHENITSLLSFHTFSQLILYPWGHQYEGISNTRDKQVHEVMAKKMAEWNGYQPQQSSGLYIASGDTTDWSYGEHKIISFTFELDPANSGWGSGGFYPGAQIIPEVQRKNLEPVLYMIEYADNPYRVLDGNGPIFKP